MTAYITITDAKRELGYERHVIEYAIDRYGPPPVGRIGISRVWHRDQLDAIRESVQRTRKPEASHR